MGLLLLAAFIGVPLIEIAVFIEVGGRIGLGWTLLLIVITAVLGAWQLRLQGLATLNRARAQLDQGVLPARELFDGLCLLFAGALLLTPGFVTDTVGFLLFLPPVRDFLRRQASDRMARQGPDGSARTRVWVNGEEVSPGNRPRGGQGGIIDGDYRDVTNEDDDDDRPGGPGRLPR